MAIANSKVKTQYFGLTAVQVEMARKKFGRNVVNEKKKIGLFVVFLKKLSSPLFLLMIGIAAVSFVVGQRAGAVIVLMMIFFSAILDFLNSYKSQKAVDCLAAQVATKITVIRDGEKGEFDFSEIVPGDVVFLSAGNVIPADCWVLESDDFFVNQSSLTGESIPMEKVAIKDEEGAVFGMENISSVFMGTSVISGFATVRVLKTGMTAEFGKIAVSLNRADTQTDFEINVMKFSIFIMKLVSVMAGIVFVGYLLKNSDYLDKKIILEAFAFALAITIGVTPDMLPAIITVCLSRGSQMMAKKDVIVKQLSAIESFGSMDILCTDKTGTLTQDHIVLVKYLNCVGNSCQKIFDFGYLSSFYHTGAQNPLDSAIKNYKEVDVRAFEKVDEIPYDFERKRSSIVVRKNGKRFLITKGAPEEVIKICTEYEIDGKVSPISGEEKNIEKCFHDLSADGFRALALCHKEIPDDDKTSYNCGVEREMIFGGFLAFLDPPKEGVIDTINELERLGIDIKILTGDNDLLAQKICRDIGIRITGVLTGLEMEKLNNIELAQKVRDYNIFARVTPLQKEQIVTMLRQSGKTVGYLGDGINDAPALKAADVGVSVSNAVDIAKDTADIILVQKSLKALKDGVIEGRKTFHNTMKFIMMGLSSNFGNMFSMMGAVVFLPFLPMLPMQVLFNNFIYDTSQFSLPSDDVDEDDLARPAHWNLPFIQRYMLVFGLISSIFDFLTFYLLYFVYHLSEHQFQTGWFIESIATQILVIYVIRTKKIPFLQSRPSRSLFITTAAAVIFAWTVQYMPLGRLMQFDRLPLNIMAVIASYVVVYLGLVEMAKRVFYRYNGVASFEKP